MRERSLAIHGVILKVNWGRKLRAFDIYKGAEFVGWKTTSPSLGLEVKVSRLIPSTLLSGLGKKCVIKAH